MRWFVASLLFLPMEGGSPGFLWGARSLGKKRPRRQNHLLKHSCYVHMLVVQETYHCWTYPDVIQGWGDLSKWRWLTLSRYELTRFPLSASGTGIALFFAMPVSEVIGFTRRDPQPRREQEMDTVMFQGLNMSKKKERKTRRDHAEVMLKILAQGCFEYWCGQAPKNVIGRSLPRVAVSQLVNR